MHFPQNRYAFFLRVPLWMSRNQYESLLVVLRVLRSSQAEPQL